MIFTVSGKYLSYHKGKSKSGKDYVYSKILCGDSVINVFGADFSNYVTYDDVEFKVRLFVDYDKRSLTFRFVD